VKSKQRIEQVPPRHFIRSVRYLSRIANLGFRTYQAHTAWRALQRVARGSLVLTLPQGTGKTFVSQLITYEYLRRNAGRKALVIAPTKELRQQYVRMAEWMGKLTPRLMVLEFKEPFSEIRKQVNLVVEEADIIVTTPELFTNRTDWISARSFKSIQLCVLDEVDLWLIDDFHDPEANRYHAAVSDLKVRLKAQSTRFLGLTASSLSHRGRALLVDDLGCLELAPFHKSIVKWLPKVRVEPVLCFDPIVVAADKAISEKSSNLVGRLNAETGDELKNHRDDFWLFIKALANGCRGPLAATLALALLDNERKRLQLFEDVPSGTAKIRHGAKLARNGRPSVVYCRQVELVNRFAREDWQSPPAIAYSGLGDRYLLETERFKVGDRDVLLMTRDLGKRGLDFPMARSLVLCSPKSSSRVMDQELCRTRGQRKDRISKIVHVLYYGGTYEEEKMRRIVTQLIGIRMYEKFQKYNLSRTWCKWLNQRPALAMLEYLSVAT
jgi:superfamily II DNA or RNA helicase